MVRRQDLLSAASLSRRSFSRLALAGGLLALAPGAYAQSQPRQGGSARIACSGTTNDTLDPRLNTTEFVQVVFFGAVSNALCETDVNGKLVGDLAETFETEPGATKWAFKLRKGLEFHNGKSVTPEDVVASIRHHMGTGPPGKAYARASEDRGNSGLSGARTLLHEIRAFAVAADRY